MQFRSSFPLYEKRIYLLVRLLRNGKSKMHDLNLKMETFQSYPVVLDVRYIMERLEEKGFVGGDSVTFLV